MAGGRRELIRSAFDPGRKKQLQKPIAPQLWAITASDKAYVLEFDRRRYFDTCRYQVIGLRNRSLQVVARCDSTRSFQQPTMASVLRIAKSRVTRISRFLVTIARSIVDDKILFMGGDRCFVRLSIAWSWFSRLSKKLSISTKPGTATTGTANQPTPAPTGAK